MKKLILFAAILFSAKAFAQPSVSEVFFPLYVQGVGSANPPDDRKVPFACRMQVNGLLANSTYRFYSLFANAPTGLSGVGAYIVVNQSGNFQRVTAATLSVAGRYQTATTDASGSFTAWFVCEPSSDINFEPGTTLYWRVFLNNPAGPNPAAVTTRITNPNPVTVMGWGSGVTQGTGLRSTAIPEFTAKNFVMLFEDPVGAGRPVAGTFIESDGTRNLSALNIDPTNEGYAPFYGDFVDGQDKTFGTMIPNNLALGVRHIAEYSLTTGTKLRACSSPDGTYGAISTANASAGLNALVLSCSPAVLPVSLVHFSAQATGANAVSVVWQTATENNTDYFVVESSSDGVHFSALGARVEARGSNSRYEKADVLAPGITYYRLRIVDADGSVSYSEVKQVQGKAGALIISPNPVKDFIKVAHGKAANGASLSVFNMAGSRLLSQPLLSGVSSSSVDVTRIPAGSYLLVFENNGTKQTVAFRK